ncbi:unnamed protein product [Cylindrotheca closterium]|uniref:Uncharacterized protein n=1 Tax=Cylindrotheca closterium TaxID=2856 RepID=A0AAD2FZI7_9STRA|nr:unnamed protein product [Cylindrotheca closterium]
MSAKQEELVLPTPIAERRRQTDVDSLISEIDSDARQKREVEKKKAVAKIFDLSSRSLVDDFQHPTKKRRITFESSSTSVSAHNGKSSTPVRLGIRCIDIGFRPRNEYVGKDSYSLSSPHKIPLLSFDD